VNEYLILKLIAALGVGLAVGGGLMILSIAKWGRRLIVGDKGEQGDRGDRGFQGSPGNTACPFAGDHPKLQEFMGETLQDRKNMRGFLDDINRKVGSVDGNVSEMKGQLDLLLRGARVRWNGALPDGGRGK
jgi:hypothetical protein